MASSVPSANGFVVVTHVYPQQGAQAFTQAQNVILPQTGAVSPSSPPLGKFLKGRPAALGTAQIMIGVVVFLFGIVTSVSGASISVYSGIMFWGAIIYITAGSLTVRANQRLNSCLVKASLGMNIISTITAGTAIIMHSFDMAIHGYARHWNRMTVGVLLVSYILEFIVSICVFAFAYKATCSSGTEVIYQAPPSFPNSYVSQSPVNTSEMPWYQNNVISPAQHRSAAGLRADRPDLPPAYTQEWVP